MKLIAIDPGQSGGVAFWNSNIIQAHSMPDTEGDILALLRSICENPGSTIAFVEEVGGYIGKAQPASSAFKFGRGFGFLLGCLQTLGVRIELVRPQKWQKTLSLGNSKDCPNKTEWKNKLKAMAQRLFPQIHVTLATTDALLILEFAIRMKSNEIERP